MSMVHDSVSQMIASTLRQELVRCRSKNSAFSLRALARRAGIHSSALSEILNGKRVVSKKVSERIMSRLGVDPDVRSQVSASLENRKPKPIDKRRLQLDADQHQYIADWFYFAILSLLETNTANSSPDWVAKRLGLSPEVAKQAIVRLERLGLIRKNGQRLELTRRSVKTPDDIKLPALKMVHQQNLDMARETLFQVEIDKRDFSAITMAIDPKRIGDAKKLTRRYLGEMEKLLEQGERTEVYKLCVQLFPLTVLE